MTSKFRTSSTSTGMSSLAADRSIEHLFTSIRNEESRHDVTKLYEGRLRSHAREFEGIKRKWEGFTGMPLPKKLKTSSSSAASLAPRAAKPANKSNNEAAATNDNRIESVVEKENNNNIKLEDAADNNGKTAVVVVEEDSAPKSVVTKQEEKPATAAVMTTKPSSQSNQQTTTSPPPLPHHPNDDINIENLKWNELRKVVKQHGLSTAGRKFELQERLKSYLEEERRGRLMEWRRVHGGSGGEEVGDEIMEEEKRVDVESKVVAEEEVDVKLDEVEQKKTDDDVAMMEEDVVEEQPRNMIESASSSSGGGGKVMSIVKQLSAKNEQIVAGETMSSSSAVSRANEMAKEIAKEEDGDSNVHSAALPQPPSSMKKEQPKSALKPSKYAPSATMSSTVHGTPVDKAVVPVKKDPPAFTANHQNNDKMMSSSKIEPNSVQKTKLISSIIEETAPSTTASAFKSAKVESAKLQEKKKNMAAASEARKARLAEMREKGLKSATKTTSTHSKYATASSTLKKMAAHSSASKPNNAKSTSSSILRAKMNEKVALAEKSVAAASASSSAMPASSSAATKPTTSASLASNNNISSSASQSQNSTTTTTVPPSQLKSKKALKSILDPANTSPAKKKPAAKPKVVEEKPLSPMQTYDMSDRDEESDESSDSEDEYETQRPKKKIPEWAQRHNLHRALERQFADGPNRLDPDKIFGEVLTCNLEDIFDKKKSRYQRRTSSGNWTKDHVTLAEKLTYKRTMGYQK